MSRLRQPMVVTVRMPRVDPNVEEGAVGRWLVACGEHVCPGQPIVEIITDKASFELEVEHGGVLRQQLAAEKSVVPVGYAIALITSAPEESLPDLTVENRAILEAYRESLLRGPGGVGVEPQIPSAAEPAPTESADASAGSQGVSATPAARRLAARTGLSLETIAARVGGVVRRSDVEDELQRRQREQQT